MRTRRLLLLRKLVLLVLLIAVLVVAVVSTRPSQDTLYPCACFSLKGENGLWLKYTWYFGQYSDEEMKQLAQRLCEYQVRYAYFHVRYITMNGTLRFHYLEEAKRLVKDLHREAPPVKLIAWIYAGNRRGQGHVNLADPAIRLRMVEEAQWLVKTCGFDGVQWDYEVCPDRDGSFLQLLQETRGLLPPGAFLSAASQVWLPPPIKHWGWSEAYFRQVCARCDQVAVMCYDTGYRTPAKYQALTAEQVQHVTTAAAAANPHCRIILGIPAWGDPDASHHPAAENVAVALKGVQDGVKLPGTHPESLAGVALFADYTAGAPEWAAYQRLWLKTPPD